MLLVLIVYWALSRWNVRWQNLFLLCASCVFYGWVDPRFVALLLCGGVIDYLAGLGLANAHRLGVRRALIGLSLTANLGTLAIFKYMSFFAPAFSRVLQAVGLHAGFTTQNFVIPLGISFFTLQRLSYTIEVYRKRIQATHDWASFMAFSCFFPLLMSGPIERGTTLLPQFSRKRIFDPARSQDALRRILWGFFKKIVIADNLAGRVDYTFAHYEALAGIDLAAGAFMFAIQLYADFSGYSDIAAGVSRLFGFAVIRNFSYPYFSRDMAEFWRRWHVSLSTWFRDYIFTPLTWNTNIKAYFRRMGCILVTFAASGLWHGAAWTYITWGILNGIGFAPNVFSKAAARQSRQVAEGRLLPTVRELFQVTMLFAYVLLGWIFFRSPSMGHALGFLFHIMTSSWFVLPGAVSMLALAIGFMIFEWLRRDREHPLDISDWHGVWRWAVYAALLLSIYYCGRPGHLDFIYTHF